MAPVQVNVDYYAVLEISNTATLEDVTKSYRRLARIHHPDKNPRNDSSTAAFQLLQNAYTTISNPESRSVYDTQWPGIRDSLRAQQAQQEENRRRAETSETERKRRADESAKKQKEDDERQEYLRQLELSSCGYSKDMFDVSGLVEKLTADLERLRDEDAEALRKERERNSWWAYLTSPISGQVNETDEQKQARIMKHLHRLASKTIKECELREQEAKFQRLWEALQGVSAKIVREKGKLAAEAQARAREKQVRMAEERMRREQQELRETAAKVQKELAERAARKAREQQATREAEERARQAAAAAERDRRDAKERHQAQKAAKESIRREQQEMREHLAKVQKEQAERTAKEARERQAAREAEEQRARKATATAAAAERARRETKERRTTQAKQAAASAAAAEEVMTPKAGKAARKADGKSRPNRSNPAIPPSFGPFEAFNPSSSSSSPPNTFGNSARKSGVVCRHDRFWPKLEGRHRCRNCGVTQTQFAFQCPGCRLIACASCRKYLKGGGSQCEPERRWDSY